MTKSRIEEMKHLENKVLKREYSIASNLIEELENNPNISQIDSLLIRCYKALILIEEGNINNALDIGEANYSDAIQFEDINLKVYYNYLLAHTLIKLGRLDEGKKYVEILDGLIENTTYPDEHVRNVYNILLKSMKGSYLRFKGKYDEAIIYYIQILDLCKKENNIYELHRTYNIIASIYQAKGEYGSALENYKLALEKAKEGGNYKISAYALNDISKIYLDIGEIELADKYLQERILMDSTVINDRIDDAYTLYSLGELEFMKGNYTKAFQFYIDGYTEIEIIGSSRLESIGLAHLILTCINLDQIEQAEYYLSIEKELVDRTDNINISGSYNYNCALVLRNKKRLTQIVNAQAILEDQLTDEKLSAQIQLKSMILFAEILILEIKLTNNEGLLETLKQMIRKLLDSGISNQNYIIVINALILQSKFAIIEGDFSEATENLDQASIYSQKQGLTILTKKINYEQKNLEEQLIKWSDISTKSHDLYEKIAMSRIHEYLQEVQKIRSELKERQEL